MMRVMRYMLAFYDDAYAHASILRYERTYALYAMRYLR